MSRKMKQGGSSRKQAPRLAIREQDDEPPREAVSVKTGGSRVGGPELRLGGW